MNVFLYLLAPLITLKNDPQLTFFSFAKPTGVLEKAPRYRWPPQA